jgi:hypothetical protein
MKKANKGGLVVAGMCVFFLGVAACTGAGVEESAPTSAPAKVEQKQEVKKPAKVYGIGDSLQVGDVVFKVNEIKSTQYVGNEFLNKKTDQQFLMVNISVTNKGKETIQTDMDFFKLKGSGSTFEADSDATIYSNDGSEFIYEDVNPGITTSGWVVFEVPADQKNFKMDVQTGLFGTEKGAIELK